MTDTELENYKNKKEELKNILDTLEEKVRAQLEHTLSGYTTKPIGVILEVRHGNEFRAQIFPKKLESKTNLLVLDYCNGWSLEYNYYRNDKRLRVSAPCACELSAEENPETIENFHIISSVFKNKEKICADFEEYISLLKEPTTTFKKIQFEIEKEEYLREEYQRKQKEEHTRQIIECKNYVFEETINDFNYKLTIEKICPKNYKCRIAKTYVGTDDWYINYYSNMIPCISKVTINKADLIYRITNGLDVVRYFFRA